MSMPMLDDVLEAGEHKERQREVKERHTAFIPSVDGKPAQRHHKQRRQSLAKWQRERKERQRKHTAEKCHDGAGGWPDSRRRRAGCRTRSET